MTSFQHIRRACLSPLRRLAAALLPLLLAAVAAPAQEDQWQFRVTPYLWAPSLSLGANIGPDPPVESETELLDILNFAALVGFEARRGRWGLIGEFNYLDLGDEGSLAGDRLRIDTGLTGTMITAALAYRAYQDERGAVDVYGGARFWSIETEIDYTFGLRTAQNDFVDPILGLRAQYDLSERWFAGATADIGGWGVGSEYQWQALARAGYRFNETWALSGGYRHLEISLDRDGTDIDAALSGPFLALDISW